MVSAGGGHRRVQTLRKLRYRSADGRLNSNLEGRNYENAVFRFWACWLRQPARTNRSTRETHLKSVTWRPIYLNSTHGGKVKLSDFRGKNTVVLAFYPAAFTGG